MSPAQIPIILGIITILEALVLFNQILHYITRPTDKNRLWYLILLVFIIINNVSVIYLPTNGIPISVDSQTSIVFVIKFFMAIYFGYYFYKAFNLHGLRFFVNKQSILFFIFAPFVFLLFISSFPKIDTIANISVSAIPLLYCIGFLYSITYTLLKRLREKPTSNKNHNEENLWVILAAYTAFLCWALLPVLMLFGDYMLFNQLVTNGFFAVMTIVYIRAATIKSKQEHQAAILLKQNMMKQIKENTAEIEMLYEDRLLDLYYVAHERKTPITLIKSYIEDHIEQKGPSSELTYIKNNLEELSSDMDNIFDSERFRRGFEVYDHDQIADFSDIVKQKLTIFKTWARRKDVKIHFTIEPNLLIKANPEAIDRIITNLIENAVKYCYGNNSVTLSLVENEGNVHFAISNKAKAIDAESQEKLFEPYYQADRKSTEGLGMGLYIVKKVVESINGQVSFQNGPEAIIKFTVIVPLHKGELPTPVQSLREIMDINLPEATTVSDSRVIDPSKPHILIVEDHFNLLAYLSEKLKERYNVYVATSGLMALKKVQHVKDLDLIISDVLMRNMNGFEFCSLILKNEKYAHIPFVFLSAKKKLEDKLTGLELGAIDYIDKPFSLSELLLKIDSIVEILRNQRTIVNSLLPKKASNQFQITCEQYDLTKREIQVAKLIIKGLPNKEIADILNIAAPTVHKHVTHIIAKVGIDGRAELVGKLRPEVVLENG